MYFLQNHSLQKKQYRYDFVPTLSHFLLCIRSSTCSLGGKAPELNLLLRQIETSFSFQSCQMVIWVSKYACSEWELVAMKNHKIFLNLSFLDTLCISIESKSRYHINISVCLFTVAFFVYSTSKLNQNHLI